MEKNYYFLTYRSVALIDVQSPEIADILKASQRNNARAGVTGFLSMERGMFVQYIEGPKPEVKALLEVLRTDRRHRDLQITSHGWMLERLYRSWRMQLVMTDDRQGADAPQIPLSRESVDALRARIAVQDIANIPTAPAR
jgi:hypothetical protein